MKKKNMFVNSFSNIIYLIITAIFSLFIRKVLIEILGVEILGLNGVIVEVISTLSLSELGIQTAIIFRLYDPVVRKDYKREGEIFALLKKAYLIIGSVIGLSGIIMLPVLRYIINVNLSMSMVYLVYLIQLGTVILSYYTCYYRVIFLVHEQQYFCSRIDIIVQILSYIVQIFILYKFKNYIVYLLVDSIRVMVGNRLIKQECKRKFSYVLNKYNVSSQDKRNLFGDLKEIVFGNIAGYVYSSTDSILISIFSSTIMVGFISNYKIITSMVRTIVMTINNSIAPTWGNYLQQEVEIEQIEDKYRKYNYIQFIECCLLLIPTICLADDFIKMMFGEMYVIRSPLLYLIVADIYIQNMHEPNVIIMRGKGMFRQDKIVSIIATIVNVIFSIVLANCMGAEGVLIGTLLALAIFWGMRSWYVHRECRLGKMNFVKYWIRNLMYFLQFVSFTYVLKEMVELVSLTNAFVEFFVQGIMIEVLLVLFFIVICSKSQLFKEEIRNIKKRRI